jgi:hypothetical protein
LKAPWVFFFPCLARPGEEDRFSPVSHRLPFPRWPKKTPTKGPSTCTAFRVLALGEERCPLHTRYWFSPSLLRLLFSFHLHAEHEQFTFYSKWIIGQPIIIFWAGAGPFVLCWAGAGPFHFLYVVLCRPIPIKYTVTIQIGY